MKTISEILTRGVAEILPTKEGLATLMDKRKITLYQGFDPSAESLHIGHLVGIRKLSQFQKLGHKVIFLVGDFTAMIGDPTDKSSARQRLTRKKVLQNLKKYKKQASTLLDFEGENKAVIKFNYDWLSKLTFEEVIDLASTFSVQQMLERDFFQKRLKQHKPIFIHEFLYPLMVSKDSVELNVDLEIGATDQLFNMMAGRSLMKTLRGKDKYVLTLKLLEDPSGAKMGKTEGNAVNLDDTPEDIYGGVMALPDGFIKRGTELFTDLPLKKISRTKPLESKKVLAFEVVNQVYGKPEALKAQKHFETTFQKRAPSYNEEIKIQQAFTATIAKASGASVSQAKRLIRQGAVDVNGVTIKDVDFVLKGGEKLKVGKKNFVKIKP